MFIVFYISYIINKVMYFLSNVYYGDDPIHLNDIEPVNFDSNHWLKGDIFLSIRSLSLIILYRPSTNKVIWYKQGPWRFQHDIDIIDEGTIAIFDNNATLGWDESPNNNNLLFAIPTKSPIMNLPVQALFSYFDGTRAFCRVEFSPGQIDRTCN